MVLVKNLGYKIQFDESTRTAMDKVVKDTKQAGGQLRIFGIPISIGGDYRQTSENTTHFSQWDNTTGTFEVLPTDDGALPTVVAMLGQRVFTV
jgi:hypothetical protein